MGKDAYICRTNKKKKKQSWKLIIANTIQFVIILPLERDLWMCADRNCPEWKALYTEARSWCFHHIIQVHTRNIDPTRSEYMRSAVRYAKTGRWSLALFPRLQFTHYRGYQPSIMTLIENKSVRSELEVVIWSRSVVLETTSTVKLK